MSSRNKIASNKASLDRAHEAGYTHGHGAGRVAERKQLATKLKNQRLALIERASSHGAANVIDRIIQDLETP